MFLIYWNKRPREKTTDESLLKFKDNIQIKNIYFRYKKNGPYVVDNFSLKISKGTKVGLIGATGSGKSTTLDLIMSPFPKKEK